MHYWELPDQAELLADQTRGLLQQHRVAPTPTNYDLWFSYALGQRADLIEALERAARDGSIRDVHVARELHAKFLAETDGIAAQDVHTRLREEIQLLAGALKGTGQKTATYSQALSSAADQLDRGVSQAPLEDIVRALAGATRAMQAQSKALETQVDKSAGEIESLRAMVDAIKAQSRTDALTGLANRRAFDEHLEEAMAESRRDDARVSLLIGDVDHFKRFNDTWGHATGDQVLRLVGGCFKANVKGQDTAARFGGEEFVVILPRTPLEGAIAVAEQIRKAVEARKIVKKSTGESLGSITISLGVAELAPDEDANTLLERADAYLYAAKQAGRNRVVAVPNAEHTARGAVASV